MHTFSDDIFLNTKPWTILKAKLSIVLYEVCVIIVFAGY